MRYFGWIGGGFALLFLSRLLERMGDLAPQAVSGTSPERAVWHSAALLIVLLALACFVRGGLLAWRAITGRGQSTSRKPATRVSGAMEAELPSDFDPDAALARYLESKKSKPAAPSATRPPSGGFGRRIV
jgi:hypothetical protein